MKYLSVSALALVVTLAACSADNDKRLHDTDVPPPQGQRLMPPIAPVLPLADTRGLKTDVYFNEELQQSIARLEGMETTLGQLQNDLQGTAAAMQRIDAIRAEIEAMNVRLQGLRQHLVNTGPGVADGQPMQMVPAPVPAVQSMPVQPHATVLRPTPLMGEPALPPIPVANAVSAQVAKPIVEAKAPVVETPAAKPVVAPVVSGAGVNGVRIGTHADRIRIVLDIGGDKLGYTANLDAAEKLLTVDLPETGWTSAKTETLKNNPVIASYTAQENGKGSLVAFTLKGDSKILDQKVLKGANGAPSRLVIDLSK